MSARVAPFEENKFKCMHLKVCIMWAWTVTKMINMLNISGGRRVNITSTDVQAADSS